jgi:hypothetical protein
VVLVALAVVISTAFGVACEPRFAVAGKASRWALQVMLYVLVPFVSFVNFAHLRLSVGSSPW